MTVERLTVALGERSYDILIGNGLLADAGTLMTPHLASNRAIIISDTSVGPLYAGKLKASLEKAGVQCDALVVNAGEPAKSFAVLETLCEQLLALTPDRKTTLIALGGGVVGDLVGFTASILLRGVPFIQVPTTLLAQVDSSVGGKTAINSKAGKNLIGSFYQPQLVLVDLDTLNTLPKRHWRAGYGEILKYGLIMDAGFYQWCLDNAAMMLGDDKDEQQRAALRYAVRTCCAMKAQVVGADEREAGMRALLNFGHTFGHALEAELQYSNALLHGEAVAIGMVMAMRMSAECGMVNAALEQQLVTHLKALGMPASPKDIDHRWDAARIAAHFVGDKKAENGNLTFILLEQAGKACVVKQVDPAMAKTVVASFL